MTLLRIDGLRVGGHFTAGRDSSAMLSVSDRTQKKLTSLNYFQNLEVFWSLILMPNFGIRVANFGLKNRVKKNIKNMTQK